MLKGHIPSLDGLRGLAILLVLVSHGIYPSIEPDDWRVWLKHGHTGVLIFFVLSGFLITHLIRREIERTGSLDLRAFYIRRLLRIFPAFYTYLAAIGSLMFLGIVAHNLSDLATAGSYTWNYRWFTREWNPNAFADAYDERTWFLGHTWSLAIEEQFYLLWPLAVVLFSVKRAKWLAITAVLLEPILRVSTHFLVPSLRGHMGPMLPWAIDPLMFGAAGALWWGNLEFERLTSRIKGLLIPWSAAVFLFFLSPLAAKWLGNPYTWTVQPTLESTAILMLLIWLVRYPNSTLGKIFNCRAAVWMGTLSYSLYLWQQLFLTPLNNTWSGRFPINFLCCFAVAAFSYFVIERPFLRIKRRFEKPA